MCLLVSHSIAGTGKAYPPKKVDGWIAWAGGECPVDVRLFVDVMFRYQETAATDMAGCWRWNHTGTDSDIIAYRLHHPQDANSRANDDRLAQHAAAHAGFASTSRDEETDLNDCIGQTPEDLEQLTRLMVEEINYSYTDITLANAYKIASNLIDAGYRKQ